MLKSPDDPKKIKPVGWKDKAGRIFLAPKVALKKAPLLAYSNYEKPFVLAKDASKIATGAALF